MVQCGAKGEPSLRRSSPEIGSAGSSSLILGRCACDRSMGIVALGACVGGSSVRGKPSMKIPSTCVSSQRYEGSQIPSPVPSLTPSVSGILKGQKRSYRERLCALGMNALTLSVRTHVRSYRERTCVLTESPSGLIKCLV